MTANIPFHIPAYPGPGFQFIVREAQGYLSREEGVVAANAGILAGGTVMGRTTSSTPVPPVVTPYGSNHGNGVVQGEPVLAEGETSGGWKATFIDASRFQVTDPAGNVDNGGIGEDEDGIGEAGQPYSGGIDLSIASGSTPFQAGDYFTIAFTSDLESIGSFVPWAPGASDGSQNFAGILMEEVDTTNGVACKRTFIVRECEIRRSGLVFAGTPTSTQVAACYAAMSAAHIALR